MARLYASALYTHIFSHLELVHRHGDAQLLLPSAPDRDATVSTAGRPCAEGHSENEDQRERGGHAERETFSPRPYIVHFLKAELMRTCVLLLCHCHSCLVRSLKLVNS